MGKTRLLYKQCFQLTRWHWSCLIASAKFQSVRRVSYNPAVMGNSQTLLSHVFVLSIHWMFCCLSITGSLWGSGCCCFSGFWWKYVYSQDRLKYSLVGKFVNMVGYYYMEKWQLGFDVETEGSIFVQKREEHQ